MDKYSKKSLFIICIMGLATLTKPAVAMEELLKEEKQIKSFLIRYIPCGILSRNLNFIHNSGELFIYSCIDSEYCVTHNSQAFTKKSQLEQKLNIVQTRMKKFQEQK